MAFFHAPQILPSTSCWFFWRGTTAPTRGLGPPLSPSCGTMLGTPTQDVVSPGKCRRQPHRRAVRVTARRHADRRGKRRRPPRPRHARSRSAAGVRGQPRAAAAVPGAAAVLRPEHRGTAAGVPAGRALGSRGQQWVGALSRQRPAPAIVATEGDPQHWPGCAFSRRAEAAGAPCARTAVFFFLVS